MDVTPIDRMMHQGLREGVFPGAVLLVGKGDDLLHFNAYGYADLFSRRLTERVTVFDLASLTKPLATTLAVAKLVDWQLLTLDEPIAEWLDGIAEDKKRITIRQLLCHASGFPAHRPYYMELSKVHPRSRKRAVLEMLESTPLEYQPGERIVYSDLGFMLLCRIVESAAGCSMDRFLLKEVYDAMDSAGLFFIDLFNPSCSNRSFAATEFCPIRNRLLVGEVHDDNAWFAGGVDGHAGLFGSAEALFRLLRALVGSHSGDRSSCVLSSRVLAELFQLDDPRRIPLGFDRPAKERSSAGRHFSKRTLGHLGYTGVSFWVDIEKDVTVILFTNRVHPTRWNNKLNRFRPWIHDQIMEHFEIV